MDLFSPGVAPCSLGGRVGPKRLTDPWSLSQLPTTRRQEPAPSAHCRNSDYLPPSIWCTGSQPFPLFPPRRRRLGGPAIPMAWARQVRRSPAPCPGPHRRLSSCPRQLQHRSWASVLPPAALGQAPRWLVPFAPRHISKLLCASPPSSEKGGWWEEEVGASWPGRALGHLRCTIHRGVGAARYPRSPRGLTWLCFRCWAAQSSRDVATLPLCGSSSPREPRPGPWHGVCAALHRAPVLLWAFTRLCSAHLPACGSRLLVPYTRDPLPAGLDTGVWGAGWACVRGP